MLKKEALHALIHALSKSEKRYFKLYCQREADSSNYIKLFDAIEKQDNYDEQAIKKKFIQETFVRQLHVTKHYLRQLILKSLRQFHADISKNAVLKDTLRNVEILYNKELYELCTTELKKAEAIAGAYELLPGLVEVMTWKRKIKQALHPHEYPEFQQIILDQKAAISALANTNYYWENAISISGKTFTPPEQASSEKQPIWKEKASTLEAKMLYYSTNYLLDLQQQQIEQAPTHLQALIDLLEQYPERIEEEPTWYIATINNLVSYQVFRKNHEDALILIQKAKKIYEHWRFTSENRSLLKQVLRTYNIELEIYRSLKTFTAEQTQFVATTEAFMKEHVHKMPKEYLVSFWFQLGSIYFMRKEYHAALHWINQLLNARFKDIRTDLLVQANMLNLMIHWEQQNLMVLRYYVDSARRLVKKVKRVQPYEEILLKFFAKLGRLPLLEYKTAFQQLEQTLFPAHGESLIPADTLNYIDYKTWIKDNQ
ncbi:MAG TPA: hypothetical protein PKA00_12715 [Saprospiraceae bacterium]|nr:hypothetical protein [Saprospiraceae bacterium]HMQ83770.1 hypothetical protein [Saprospiraceae bacterium]